jgi:hypothetical protein
VYVNTHAVNDSLLNAGIVRLSGALSAEATARGNFGIELEGDAPAATSTASGVLSVGVRCAAAVEATATTTGALFKSDRVYPINGEALNVFSVNAPNNLNISGTATATATTAADLKKEIPVAASVTATAEATAPRIAGSQRLASAVTAEAALSGTALYTRQLAVAASAAATTTAAATYIRELSGAAFGSAAGVGTITRILNTGVISGAYTPSQTLVTSEDTRIYATYDDPNISVDVTTTSIYANATQ